MRKPKPPATCATCPFWKRANNTHGACHRLAPESAFLTLWPPTQADDWCGQHPGRRLP